MGMVKILSTSSLYTVVEVATMSDIRNCTLQDLKVFHPSTIIVKYDGLTYETLPSIQKNFVSAKVTRVIVERPPNNIVGNRTKVPWLSKSDLSMNDLSEIVAKSYIKEKDDRMRFLSRGESLQLSNATIAEMSVEDSLVLREDGKVDSMLVLHKTVFNGENYRLVAWIWIDKTLGLKRRQDCQRKMQDWLSYKSQEKVMASIHLENKNSLSLFKRWGFAPCYFTLRL